MSDRNGISMIIASLILGTSVIAASLLVRGSIDRTAGELAQVRTAIASSAVQQPAPGQPSPSRAPRPDSSKRYVVNTAGSPVKGRDEAKVTMVEFSDFQCPFCSRVMPTLEQIRDNYGDDVRVVFKHLPLRAHAKAPAAHAAAEAAHRQGKFWEMHDKIFENQGEMSPEKYVGYAVELGLDVDQFKVDVRDTEVLAKVKSDTHEAAALGVTGTPGFFINGRFLSGARPFESFKTMIDEELSKS